MRINHEQTATRELAVTPELAVARELAMIRDLSINQKPRTSYDACPKRVEVRRLQGIGEARAGARSVHVRYMSTPVRRKPSPCSAEFSTLFGQPLTGLLIDFFFIGPDPQYEPHDHMQYAPGHHDERL